MEENLTFQLLKYQFLNGCEKVTCNNPLCLSNPDSLLHTKTKKERIKMAEFYSDPEDITKLCDGLPLRYTVKKCFHAVVFFDTWAKSLKDQIHLSQAQAFLQSIFGQPEFAGYILLQENVSLSKTNPSIDEINFMTFVSKLSTEPALNDILNNYIKNALKYIQSNINSMKYSTIRLLLILFYFPNLLDSPKNPTLLPMALHLIRQLNQKCKSIFKMYLSRLTELRRKMITISHQYIAILAGSKSQQQLYSHEIEMVLQTMQIMHDANQMADNPLPPQFFVNQLINDGVDINIEILYPKNSHAFTFFQYPFILSLKAKVHAGKSEMRNMLRKLILNGESKHMRLKVRRQFIVADSVQQILAQSGHAFVRKLRVTFDGEKAVDAGGPSREFLYLLSEKLLSPDYGMFVHVNGVKWFSPTTLEGDRSFFLVGTVLGLAIRNNVILPIRFPRVLYKKLLNPNPYLTLGDLSEVLPEVGKSLQSILEMRAVGEDVSSLDLTFETTIECFGQNVSVPLIEGMGGVEVTNENVEQYINAYVNFELDSRIKTSFEAFKRGFDLACPGKIYRTLDPAEIDIIVSGEEVYDWAALKTTTKYANATEKSRAIHYFWDIFDSLTQKEKMGLLKFITGSDRTPYGGLKNLKITINVTKDIGKLPTAHTCFNILDLPNYPTQNEMRDKIIYATFETEGFGLV